MRLRPTQAPLRADASGNMQSGVLGLRPGIQAFVQIHPGIGAVFSHWLPAVCHAGVTLFARPLRTPLSRSVQPGWRDPFRVMQIGP